LNTELMFSSKDQTWETPKKIFDQLNNEFHFTLDPCSSHENHKCEKYYTVEDDGLSKDWSGEVVFVNPPYGRELKLWVKKCFEESIKENTVVVLLVPSRTDTQYQHEFVFKYAKAVCFLKGRLKFGDSKNSAPFPSQVILFAKENYIVPKGFLEMERTILLR